MRDKLGNSTQRFLKCTVESLKLILSRSCKNEVVGIPHVEASCCFSCIVHNQIELHHVNICKHAADGQSLRYPFCGTNFRKRPSSKFAVGHSLLICSVCNRALIYPQINREPIVSLVEQGSIILVDTPIQMRRISNRARILYRLS